MRRASEYLESIKFSHTIFALPFALMAVLLAFRGFKFNFLQLLWIVLAMVGARTWAMVVNRLVDAKIDAMNARTATRAIPAGQIAKSKLLLFGLGGAFLFVSAASLLSRLAFILSVPLLLFLGSYSFAKRFTWLCHFWLGVCLGIAPSAAWLAIRGEISLPLLWLSAAIALWVAGFDIIYSLQDEEFDRSQALHSVPARFGAAKARVTAALCHFSAIVLFGIFGHRAGLGILFALGLGLASSILIVEHYLIRGGRMEKIPMVFFNLNGWIAVLLFAVTAGDLYLQP